jgi:signal transduction histidine kinase
VVDLARECGGLLDVLLEEKQQALTIAGDPEITVTGDRFLLRQALLNIVHNAIKYSPIAGVINIQVKLRVIVGGIAGSASIEVW